MTSLENKKEVSKEIASSFFEVLEDTVSGIALGVSLCVASPAVLVALIGLSKRQIISQEVAAVIGAVVIIAFVLAAVVKIVKSALVLDPYKPILQGEVEITEGADKVAKDRRFGFERKYSRGITVGTVFCALVIAPLTFMILYANSMGKEFIVPIMTAVILVLVAFGVNNLVRSVTVMEIYNKFINRKNIFG